MAQSGIDYGKNHEQRTTVLNKGMWKMRQIRQMSKDNPTTGVYAIAPTLDRIQTKVLEFWGGEAKTFIEIPTDECPFKYRDGTSIGPQWEIRQADGSPFSRLRAWIIQRNGARFEFVIENLIDQ